MTKKSTGTQKTGTKKEGYITRQKTTIREETKHGVEQAKVKAHEKTQTNKKKW